MFIIKKKFFSVNIVFFIFSRKFEIIIVQFLLI